MKNTCNNAEGSQNPETQTPLVAGKKPNAKSQMKWFNYLGLTVTIVAISLPPMEAQVTLTSLVSFSGTNGATPGNVPEATLIQGRDGNFYGTTLEGGTNGIVGFIGGIGGFGTVFKISTNGAFTSLVSFDNTNGSEIQAGLIQASDGNFYGDHTAWAKLSRINLPNDARWRADIAVFVFWSQRQRTEWAGARC